MAQYASGSGVVRGTPITLKASGAETASTNGGAVATGPDSGSLYVEVNVTAASGTTPTLTVAIQGSMDGTNWFTLGTIGANGYNTGAVGVTAPSNFTGVAGPVRAYYDMPQYVRYSSTIGGTTPSFTYTVTGVAGN